MIVPEVTLSTTEGNLQRREFRFHGPTDCLVGRAEDCAIRLGRGFGAGEISRHHCLFEIDPPHVWVRDLGSLNGTFVNSESIGQRPREQAAEEVAPDAFALQELQSGDVVRIGHTIIRVHVMPFAAEADEPMIVFPSSVLWM
jgi:eukaryotic-like serine/threonine-protein kinase